jgi:hypothetical protein
MPPIAPRRRPFRPHNMHHYRLLLARSRCAQLRKANNFLAHLALLVGPEALSRPATAQKSLGAGASPPLRPPLRRYAAPWLGYAQPKTPKRGGLAASPQMGGEFNCHAANSRIPSFAFYVHAPAPSDFCAVAGRERASGPTRRAKWAKKLFALRSWAQRDLAKTSR